MVSEGIDDAGPSQGGPVPDNTSSFVEMQVNEVLNETRANYEATASLNAAVRSLKEYMDQLPDAEVPSSLAGDFFRRLGVPGQTSLAFKAPASVSMVGSYLLKAVAGSRLNVDMAVRMPSACFLEKDYRDHRYHGKRALYLVHLARELAKHEDVAAVELQALEHDPKKPVLVVTPAQGAGGAEGWAIRLLPCIAADVFPAARLGPGRGNLKSLHDESCATAALPPSPEYNLSVLEDTCFEADMKVVHSYFSQHPSLRDAAILAKLWGHSRELHAPHGISGFTLSLLICHLCSQGRISPSATPFQMFGSLLTVLADPATFTKGTFARVLPKWGGSANAAATITAETLPHSKEVLARFPAVVAGASGGVNVAHRTSREALREVQHAARLTAQRLHRGQEEEAVHAAFVAPLPPPARSDLLLQIDLPPRTPEESQEGDLAAETHSWRREEDRIAAVVGQVLGDRATLVSVIRRRVPGPELPAKGKKKGQASAPQGPAPPALISLLLDPETAYRQVDMGPDFEDKAAVAKFRALWGDKAELRRFRDGKIAESVVWSRSFLQRPDIVPAIAAYGLARHLPLTPAMAGGPIPAPLKVQHAGTALDEVLGPSAAGELSDGSGGSDPSRAARTIQEAVDRLTSAVQGLDLPLKVVNVQSAMPPLRHAALRPPPPHPLAGVGLDAAVVAGQAVPACVAPLEVLLSLEGSGKWPDHPAALAKTKTSYLILLGQRLEAAQQARCVPTEPYLDVLLDGFCFRVFLATERDPAPKAPLIAHIAHRTAFAALLHPVYTEKPCYGAAVRAAKRWVAAHMFSNHIHDDQVELLVAHTFTERGAGDGPATVQAALLRFLRLLAEHPWRALPLLVDPQGTAGAEPRAAALAAFTAARQAARGPALFLASPLDPAAQAWDPEMPSSIALQRMVQYAGRSAALLQALIAAPGPPPTPSTRQLQGDSSAAAPSAATLFTTPTDCFDVLIWLRPEAVPALATSAGPSRSKKRRKLEKGNGSAWVGNLPPEVLLSGADAVESLLVGFHPVGHYLHELKARFAELAIFFYNDYDGDVIGVMFNPTAFIPSSSVTMQSGMTNFMLPVGAGSTERPRIPNVVQMLQEFATMGEGLVEKVQVNIGDSLKF